MCRTKLHDNVFQTKATKASFATLKSRMISAPVLLIPKMRHDAEFVVAIDASKIGIAGVFSQEDTSGSLIPCAY